MAMQTALVAAVSQIDLQGGEGFTRDSGKISLFQEWQSGEHGRAVTCCFQIKDGVG
jgi:hypothetical protein